MSVATRITTVGVTLSPKRDKLVLRGPKSDAANEFYHSLPGGKWDALMMAWTVEATPSAAWRLLNECPINVEADDAVLRLASIFAESLDVLGECTQPAVRKTDGWRHQLVGYHFVLSRFGVYQDAENYPQLRDVRNGVHGLGVSKQDDATVLQPEVLAQKTQQPQTKQEGGEGIGGQTGRDAAGSGAGQVLSQDDGKTRTSAGHGSDARSSASLGRDSSPQGWQQAEQRAGESGAYRPERPRQIAPGEYGKGAGSVARHASGGAMLAMGMGAGKSWCAVNVIVNLRARKTLILCPASVLPVWRREFDKHAGRPVEVLVLDKGTVSDKTKRADAFLARCDLEDTPGAIVINYESAWRDAFARWSLKTKWDVAVADESHRIKGHDTAIGKYAEKLGRVAAFRLCLTGTPMPHSPLDLFSQFRFLDRGIFGSSFHHFRNRYARCNPMFPGKVDEWLNQDELTRRFWLLSYRVTADEVLDLPEVMHHRRPCRLSPAAEKIYKSLENDLIADVGSGVVTAANALTRLLRLQQVTSGFVIEDETKRVQEVDDGKETALAELIEDVGPDEPIVVFCRFRYDLAIVERLAQKLGRVYGELSGRKKDGLDDRGCMMPGIQVMGVQIQSGGVGVDLTAARYCVYYSLGFSLGDYLQSLARVHRPGQSRHVHYFHLIATGTVDEAVYGALENRQEVVNTVLEALKR